MAAVTLQGAIEKTRQMRNMIGEQKSVEDTRRLAHEIYHDMIEMVAAELQGKSLIHDERPPHPILKSLHKILEDTSYQGYLELQRSFSKIFRVVVELSWYQSWRLGIDNKHEKILVDSAFKKDLVDISSTIKKILRARRNVTGARFEFRCAKEAAKRLEPSTELWKKYTLHVINLSAAGADRSAGAIWAALKPLIEDISQDCPLGWYLWYQKVHILRWESTLVRTLKDFEEKIVPKIAACREEGGNFSLCLAIVFIELIRRPNVDLEVKRRAFKELIELTHWERRENLKEYIKHPSEITHKLMRKADRFWETREVALRFLSKLATSTKDKYKEKYSEYRADSLSAIRTRSEELSNKKSEAYAEEKRQLSVSLGVMQTQSKDFERQLVAIGEQSLNLESSRGGRGLGDRWLDEEPMARQSEALARQASALEEAYISLNAQIEERQADLLDIDARLTLDQYEANFISQLLENC